MTSLGLEGEIPPAPEEPPFEALPPQKADAKAAKPQPLAPSSELYLVSCCMYDIEGIHWPKARHLPEGAFHDTEAKAIWGALQRGLTLARDEKEFLAAAKLKLRRAIEIEGCAGTGTGFRGWLDEVQSKWQADEKRRIAELLANNPDIDPVVAIGRLEALLPRKPAPKAEPLSGFAIPASSDPSVLLGERYLNRGDGLVLSSTSGMGKSSLDLQMAVCYALGRDFHGIKPSRALSSLIVQAEDSDGDIGEVWLSLRHAMKLTDAEAEIVKAKVLVVTERVRRGGAFMGELSRLIAKHRPDLVHINPLQAFIEGDVTESRDLGDFLRAGLNSLNEPPTFGYIVVHHTTKPATGRDRAERLWHEVMYDMAGGAEIINWARAIMSLRAAGEPGEFNLVLAKRGIRAGVVKAAGTAGQFRDPVTTIALRHSTDLIEIPGVQKRLRCIFWEARDGSGDKARTPDRDGRPPLHKFADFKAAFAKTRNEAYGINQVIRCMKQIRAGIGNGAGQRLVDEAVADGQLHVFTDDKGRPKYWISP